MIQREFTANRLNAILNHPAVRPWVANDDAGVIDVSAAVSNERNVLLMGEHGGMFFVCLQPGIYELHTQVLPSGRGEWARDMAEACALFMFTRTDAFEVLTRIPGGHVAARVAAEAMDMRMEFLREGGCVFKNRVTDLRVYSQRIQEWAARAPGMVDLGRWLHNRMAQEAARLGLPNVLHDDDENHNRYVGVATAMAFGGQPGKAVSYYNRWVSICRHGADGKLHTVELVSVNPLVIRFDLGLMKMVGDDIEVIRTC